MRPSRSKCAREGARIVLNGRSEERGARVLQAIEAIDGMQSNAVFIRADLSVKSECQRLINKVIDEWGRVDVLVNNAQSISKWQSAEDDKIDEGLAYIMTSGLHASLWLSQAVFASMRDQHWGRIVNFGSASETFGSRHGSAYNATKGAIVALSRTLANEWGPYGITVNTVLPAGPSPGHDLLWQSRARLASENPKFAEQVTQYEMTAPYQPFVLAPIGEDIGAAVVGLASDSGRFMTGQVLNVDGGLHLWGLNQHMNLPGQEYES